MMLRIPIPEGWGEAPLKDVVTFCTDYLPENTSPDFSFRYVDIGSVEHGKGITRFQEMSFSEAPSRARKRVRRGDTIVSTVRTYLKAIAHVDEDENFIVGAAVGILDQSGTGGEPHVQPGAEEARDRDLHQIRP